MRIYIIRHGQTELNNRQVLQGRSDFPLNAQGIAQAEALIRGARESGREITECHVILSTKNVRTGDGFS